MRIFRVASTWAGNYHVSWMMRDRMERVCSSSWNFTADLPKGDQNIKLAIVGNAIEPSDRSFLRPSHPLPASIPTIP